MSKRQAVNTKFVSETDQFLSQLAAKYPTPSKLQQVEIEKYRRVFGLRDSADAVQEDKTLWEGF